MEVLNNQYESVYSEMGEKDFQLYQLQTKLKETEDKLAEEKQKFK